MDRKDAQNPYCMAERWESGPGSRRVQLDRATGREGRAEEKERRVDRVLLTGTEQAPGGLVRHLGLCAGSGIGINQSCYHFWRRHATATTAK
jgi:hypothetical protein